MPGTAASENMFPGFAPMAANFTPTPNAFFDRIVGHYPLCVVTVVAILIRETNGWTDSVTGEKRAEAELPISKFIRPDFSKNSAREGLKKAIAAGFVVETASHTNRDGSRYALRWADDNALRTIIERQRKAKDDTRPLSDSLAFGVSNSGVPNSGPPKSGRPNSGPPINKESVDGKESVVYNVSKKPLNVTESDIARLFGQTFNEEERDLYAQLVLDPVREVVSMTEDSKSRMRFVQLREICLKNNATGAWSAAFVSLEKRLQSKTAGKLAKPGAYFNTVAVRELEKRGITVPIKSEEPDRVGVRDLIAASLSDESVSTGRNSRDGESAEPDTSPAGSRAAATGDSCEEPDATGDVATPPTPCPKDSETGNLMSEVLKLIQETTRSATFQTHFKPLRLVSLRAEDGVHVATVSAPSDFTKSFIESRHKSVLRSAFAEAWGHPVTVRLVVGDGGKGAA